MYSSYTNFEILIGPGAGNAYPLYARAPGGEGRATLHLPSEAAFQQQLAALAGRSATEADLTSLGEALFLAIFSGPIASLYARTQGQLADGQGVRLTLMIDPASPAVASLPWEFMRDPQRGPLALLDVPLLRTIPQQATVPALGAELPLKLLLAGTAVAAPGEVAAELESIQAALKPLGAFVELTIEPQLSTERLMRLLRSERFHALHLVADSRATAHGTAGALLFTEAGKVKAVRAQELGVLLNRTNIRLAVLSARQPAGQPADGLRGLAEALIRAQVAAVVTVPGGGQPEAARAFVAEFYQALAEGLPIDACVTEGRKAVMGVSGLDQPDWGLPGVLSRAPDGRLFNLPPLPKPACPYPGMVPFSAADSRFFYGREAEIEQLLQRLRHHRLLAVIGPSGSGKSSLVRAGLLPRLGASSLFPPDYWQVTSLRPGAWPVAALCQALGASPTAPLPPLAQLLAPHAPAQRRLVLIDQFEETFTQASRDEQRAWFAVLNELRRDERCTLLLAMRADFYADLIASELWPIDPAQRLEIAPLRGAALRAAIERPAAEVGVRLEPGLVERVLADAADEPGVLPLLQETLVLLWDRMPRRLLTVDAYEQLGDDGRSGLATAIATKADATYANLSPDQQAIARRIFLRLVSFGEGRADTRRQQPLSALQATSDAPATFASTLRALVDSRLLMVSDDDQGRTADGRRKTDDDERLRPADQRTNQSIPNTQSPSTVYRPPSSVVDLAHEALIAGWPRLAGWLAEGRSAEQTRRRLSEKAREWLRLGQGSGGLLDEIELHEAERWLAGEGATGGVDADLARLLDASRNALTQAAQQREADQQRALAQAQALAAEQSARAEAEGQARNEAEGRAEAQRQRAEAQVRSTRQLRQRAVFLAVAACLALLAAGAAAFFAVDAATKRTEALAERDRADQQARLAAQRERETRAQLNASEAVAELNRNNFDRALLLARAAVTSDTGQLSPLAASALRQMIEQVPPSYRLVAPETATLVGVATWSQDGRRVALLGFSEAANGDVTPAVSIWDATSGARVQTIALAQPLQLSSPTALLGSAQLALNPDGSQVLFALGGNSQLVGAALWEVASASKLADLGPAQVAFTSVGWSPDGRWFYLSQDAESKDAAEQPLQVWDAASRKPLRSASGQALAWSNDGQLLVAEESETALGYILDVASGERRASLARNGSEQLGRVTIAAWRSDNSALLVVSPAGVPDEPPTLRVWDAASGARQEAYWPPLGDSISSLVWNAENQTIRVASYQGTIRLIDLASSQTLWQQPVSTAPLVAGGMFYSLPRLTLWSPDGQRVLVANGNDLTGEAARVWDLQAGGRRVFATSSCTPCGPTSLAWSSDGSRLMAKDTDGLSLWDAASGTSAATAAAALSDAPVLRPDGSLVAFIDIQTRDILIRELPGMAQIQGISPPTYTLALAWSHDGTRLASSHPDSKLRVWDVASGKLLHTLSGSAPAHRLAWAADDKQIALSELGSAQIDIWQLESEQHHTIKPGGLIAWNRTGTRLLVGNNQPTKALQVVDATSGEPVMAFAGAADVLAADWSADERLVISKSRNNTIQIWDAASGTLLETLEQSTVALAWNPDSRRFASGYNGITRIQLADYRLMTAELTRRVCRVMGDEQINGAIAGWRGCSAELAAVAGDLRQFDALWGK